MLAAVVSWYPPLPSRVLDPAVGMPAGTAGGRIAPDPPSGLRSGPTPLGFVAGRRTEAGSARICRRDMESGGGHGATGQLPRGARPRRLCSDGVASPLTRPYETSSFRQWAPPAVGSWTAAKGESGWGEMREVGGGPV